MASHSLSIAKTPREAFRACDVGPLQGETLQYYVNLEQIRSEDAFREVRGQLDLLNPQEFKSLLFTGHRGCGKSTELRRLQQAIESDYRVIYLDSIEELDIQDADYTDLYLVIIQQIADDLARLRLGFDPILLEEFQKWFLEVTRETVESVEKSVSLETQAEAGFEIPFISKLAAKLLSQIKGGTSEKQTIRQTLQRDNRRLKEDLNRLLKDAFQQVSSRYAKGFLVIFDSLDRLPPHVGDRLYFEYAAQLQELNCTLIYTVPISAAYSPKNINNAFESPNIMPMVDIYHYQAVERDLKFNAEALEKFAKLVEQRIDLDAVFASRDLVDQLVAESGGHVRQLMQMTATACLAAHTRSHEKVQQEDVMRAIKKEQNNFERIIPKHHYPLMLNVCHNKRIDHNEDGQVMLFNTSVLEYENEQRRWNYINPLVRRSQAFQELLNQPPESASESAP